MILDELVLINFGIFQGEHRAVLTPPRPDRPIVLIGGMNGGGKTTILEATQLAFHGRLAPIGRLKGCSYDDYLRRCINREVRPSDGASVELAFHVQEEGAERHYRIRRTWSQRGEGIREDIDVSVDGQYSDALSKTWPEQVDRFMPSRLVQLFFFDGERIEELADPKQSANVLRTAVHSLLGVDLVNQLATDLSVIQRRNRKKAACAADRGGIETIEKELEQAESALDEMTQREAALRSRRGLLAKRLEEARHDFDSQGGRLLSERDSLTSSRAAIAERMKSTREQLVSVASGHLPISLVTDLVSEMLEVAASQLEQARSEAAGSAVREYREQLCEHLAHQGVEHSVLEIISAFGTSLAAPEPDCPTSGEPLGLTEADVAVIREVTRSGLPEATRQASALLSEYASLEEQLDDLESRLAAIPEDEALAVQISRVAKAESQLEAAESELALAEKQATRLMMVRDQTAARLDALLKAQRMDQLEHEDARRIVEHTDLVRADLETFRSAIVQRHSDSLASVILDGYRRLLRKESLLNRVEIDPQTCSLRLFNGSDAALPPERLSAGERQLLAVSILWGLGRAASRPLPVIIDTPLGRLDSSHRANLVGRYFPEASHQVVLLSTDEEIDAEHLETLRPAIGRTYRLGHDAAEGAAAIRPGYFWED